MCSTSVYFCSKDGFPASYCAYAPFTQFLLRAYRLVFQHIPFRIIGWVFGLRVRFYAVNCPSADTFSVQSTSRAHFYVFLRVGFGRSKNTPSAYPSDLPTRFCDASYLAVHCPRLCGECGVPSHMTSTGQYLTARSFCQVTEGSSAGNWYLRPDCLGRRGPPMTIRDL